MIIIWLQPSKTNSFSKYLYISFHTLLNNKISRIGCYSISNKAACMLRNGEWDGKSLNEIFIYFLRSYATSSSSLFWLMLSVVHFIPRNVLFLISASFVCLFLSVLLITFRLSYSAFSVWLTRCIYFSRFFSFLIVSVWLSNWRTCTFEVESRTFLKERHE